jgi:hypothetical protein
MTAGESLAEHSTELWIILGAVLSITLGLIGLVYRGLVKRMEKMESKIPDLSSIVTLGNLTSHCSTMQLRCPQNATINQIAEDTKEIRADMKEVMEKQSILREKTLPDKYLTIDSYERTILRIELSIRDMAKEIKDTISEKVKDLKALVEESKRKV